MSAIANITSDRTTTLSLSLSETVVAEAARACDDRYRRRLQALILTGSLSRKEGTVLMDEGTCRLLGDADFLLVFRRRSSIPRQEELRSLAESVSDAARVHGIDCRIHLAGVAPGYLRRLPQHIFSYELRHAGRVVLGDPRLLQLVPEFPPEAIDREDAWRLLSNRMIEWLEALAGNPDDASGPTLDLLYATTKLWVDAATSLLAFLGGYEPSYCARRRRLTTLASQPPPSLPFPLAELSAGCESAARLKFAADMTACRRFGWEFCRRARDLATSLWCWELAQLAGLDPAWPPIELVKAWGRATGAAGRCRGWVRAARETGWLAAAPGSAGWRSLAAARPGSGFTA